MNPHKTGREPYSDSRARYFQILGLPPTAGKAAIREAFRRKAKLLHPDRNAAPDAAQKFVELYEAYEHLYREKGREKPRRPIKNYSHQARQAYYRQKAERAAKMRYEEFLRSEQYKKDVGVNLLLNLLFAFFLLIVLVIVPIFGYFSGTDPSVLVLPLLVLLFWPLWKQVFRFGETQRWKFNISAVHYVLQKEKLWFCVGIVVNFIALIYIFMHALIKPLHLFLIYALAVLVGWLAVVFFRKERQKKLLPRVRFILGPTLVLAAYTVNSFWSISPREECYRFVPGGNQSQATTLIVLENNAYEEYPGVRFFGDMYELNGNKKVCLSFATGILGVEVLKDARFYPH